MKEGKASETKSGNKGLVILLCVLVVAIIGLGVGIGVSISGSGKDDTVDDEFDGFAITDDPMDADYILNLERTAADFEDVRSGVELYEAAIDVNINNVDNLLKLRIAYSDFLLNQNQYGGALAQLNMIDQSVLDARQIVKLCMAYRDYYLYIEDYDKATEYNVKVQQLVKENDFNEYMEF